MLAALRSGGQDRAGWISRLASIAVLAITFSVVAPVAAARADDVIVVVATASQTYGGPTGIPVVTYDGQEQDDRVLVPPICLNNSTPQTGVGLGAGEVSCDFTSAQFAPGWSFTFTDGDVTIAPASATVTASGASTTYGSIVPVSITPIYSGLVNDETSLPGVICGTDVTPATGAGIAISSCSGAVADNYVVDYVNGSVTIDKAVLTITAGNTTGQRGATPPVTPSFSGFLNGDQPTALSAQPTCTSTAVAVTNVGTYPNSTSCAGAAANNYSFSYANGSTTITPAPLTVTAVSSSRQAGASNPPCSVNYAGFVGGETSAVLAGTLACSTSANAGSGPGTYSVTPSGQSSPNYTITFVPGTITVTAAPPPPPTPTPTATPTPTPTPTPTTTPTRTTTPTPTPTPTGEPDEPTDFGWVPILLVVVGGLVLIALVIALIVWSRRRGM